MPVMVVEYNRVRGAGKVVKSFAMHIINGVKHAVEQERVEAILLTIQ